MLEYLHVSLMLANQVMGHKLVARPYVAKVDCTCHGVVTTVKVSN